MRRGASAYEHSGDEQALSTDKDRDLTMRVVRLEAPLELLTSAALRRRLEGGAE